MKKYTALLIIILSAILCFSACGTVSQDDENDETGITVLSETDTARLYESIYDPEREKEMSVYRDEKVTLSDIDNRYIQKTVYSLSRSEIYGELEGFTSDILDDIGENYVYMRIFPVELFNSIAHGFFGSSVEISHTSFQPAEGIVFEYEPDNERYLCYTAGGGDDPVPCWKIMTGYSQENDYIFIYDKYIFPDFSGDNVKLYTSSEMSTEIVDAVLPEHIDEARNYTSIAAEYGTAYKHTFALAANGTYYWVSTERN